MTTNSQLSTVPQTPPAQVILTDVRGNMRHVRTPSHRPPPCIVRAGEGPNFPMPMTVRSR